MPNEGMQLHGVNSIKLSRGFSARLSIQQELGTFGIV